MTAIATIGVYGFTRETFLSALGEAGIDLVLDVRQRRGVRGSEYAWANARRLQDGLSEAGISYSHLKELAPTTAAARASARARSSPPSTPAATPGRSSNGRTSDRSSDGSAARRRPCSASSAIRRPATAR